MRGKDGVMTKLETPFPMARVSDPATSHDAAEKQVKKLSDRRKMVFDFVQAYPGRTHGELAAKLYKETYNLGIIACVETPHKRLPELEKLGLVRRGRVRKCGETGHSAATWWLEPKQERLFK